MVQVRKPEVEQRLLDAAVGAFAEHGYRGASMADIAARAGLSTGNTYRYFANKDELFYAVVSDELAATFLALVRRRVGSLIEADDLGALGPDAQADADALMAFWVNHRLQVVILLARAEGSRFGEFRETFVQSLLRPSRKNLLRVSGLRALPPDVSLVLRSIFDNTASTLVTILRECASELEIRGAFRIFWSYQLAGLAGLVKELTP